MQLTIFEKNAEILRELNEAIKVSVVNRHLDREHHEIWVDACRRFNASFDRLSFPGGMARQLELLKDGDSEAVEMAIRYLEANPWCFRSGYVKEELLEDLKKVELTDEQQERLRDVIMQRIEHGSGREFRRYCQLARKLINEDFLFRVRQAMDSEVADVSRRAGWVMSTLES